MTAVELFKYEQRATAIDILGLSKLFTHTKVNQLKTGRGVCVCVKGENHPILHIKISELLMLLSM